MRNTCYIACPAFALHGPLDRDRVISDITAFTDKVGLEVVRSPLLDRHLGHGAWLPAEERRADILRAIEHDLVWPVRGGHGSIHLAATLLAAKTSKRPVLIGYSDVTILHACWKVRGWGESFYGSVPAQIRGCRGGETLMALLSGEGFRRSPEVDAGVRVLRPGKVTAPCFTACCSVLAGLCGTPYLPKLRGCVLAIEDTNEKPYMIDGVLNQLFLSGALDGIVGLIGGGFPHEEKPDYSGPSMEEILIDWAQRLQVPTIAWLPFGHINDGLILPCGRTVTLDARKNGDWSLTVAQRDDSGRKRAG